MVEIRPRKGEKYLAFKKRVIAEARKRRKEAAAESFAAEVRAFACLENVADAIACVDHDGKISIRSENAPVETSTTWQEVGPIETKEDIERRAAREAEENVAREAEEAAGKALLNVFNEAREAYYVKKRIEDNPYPVRSRLGLAWMFGFNLSQCRDQLRVLSQDHDIGMTWYRQKVKELDSELNRPREFKVNMAMKVPKTAFAQAK